MKKGICFFLAAILIVLSVFCPSIKVKALTEEETYLSIAEMYRAAMTQKQASVSFPEYELSAEYAEKLYYYVLVTNPMLYYAAPEYNAERATFSEDGKYLNSYEFEYVLTDTEYMDKKLNDAISAIADEIFEDSMHTVDMLLAIHEYIASNVDKPASRDNITDDMLCSSVYGAAVYGCADSRGYSLLYKLLAEEYTGNDCIVVADSTWSLYWNMYRLGENWYHVDVYSDDLENVYYDAKDNPTDAYLFGGNISHAYFLVTTPDLLSKGHTSGNALSYAPAPVAETDTIRIRIWPYVMSRMCYYDGYWNYISPTSSDKVVKRLTSVVLAQSSEITVAEFDNPINAFTIYDEYMYAYELFSMIDDNGTSEDESDDEEIIEFKVHKRTAQGMDNELLYTTAENEYIIGLNDRGGVPFYELYNISTREYKYIRINTAKSNGKMNVNVQNDTVCGFYAPVNLEKFLNGFSGTGLASKYDALNTVTVFVGENEITDYNEIISSGATVKLADGTEYTISATGDLNSDGKLNILDVMTVLSSIAAPENLTALQQYSAEYMADGSINIADAAAMMSDIIPKSDAQNLPTTETVE